MALGSEDAKLTERARNGDAAEYERPVRLHVFELVPSF
jgi:hypothetical protein